MSRSVAYWPWPAHDAMSFNGSRQDGGVCTSQEAAGVVRVLTLAVKRNGTNSNRLSMDCAPVNICLWTAVLQPSMKTHANEARGFHCRDTQLR